MKPSEGLKNGRRLRDFLKSLSTFRRTQTARTDHTDSGGPSPIQPPSWSYYESIDELPLTVFIKCAVTGDFSGLIKEGKVPGYLLNSAWLHIHSDYCSRIGGVHITSLINKSKSVNALASKIDRIKGLVNAIRLFPIDKLQLAERIAADLRAEGFNLDLGLPIDQIALQLDTIIAKLRPDTLRLNRMIADMPKDTDNKPATEREFINMLIECSKFEGYELHVETMKTGKYCEHVRRLREHIDAQMKAAKRHN